MQCIPEWDLNISSEDAKWKKEEDIEIWSPRTACLQRPIPVHGLWEVVRSRVENDHVTMAHGTQSHIHPNSIQSVDDLKVDKKIILGLCWSLFVVKMCPE